MGAGPATGETCPRARARASTMPESVRTARARSALLVACLAVALGAGPAPAAAGWELEVSKSRRELLVKNGPKVERRYKIATGRGGRGDKQSTGDNRTPTGRYRIVRFNDGSRFAFFMHLNYPNLKDAFYGLKNEVITRADFDRIITALRTGRVPPQNTRLGGLIGIHGLGDATAEQRRLHDKVDWTEGCIALDNDDIEDLRRYVTVGTVVVIAE